jgi:hypothetical protein
MIRRRRSACDCHCASTEEVVTGSFRESLRNLCVLCVSAVKQVIEENHHRDAENAEVTQRRIGHRNLSDS